MTSANTTNNVNKAVQVFQHFNEDEKLALLWFIYTEIGRAIDPKGGPDTNGFNIVEPLINRIKQTPQNEQLQVQRDIVAGNISNPIVRTYADLSSSGRLAFWYVLAQAMDEGAVVQVPADFQVSSEARNFLNSFKTFDFNDQITFMRNVVALVGPAPKETGAVV